MNTLQLWIERPGHPPVDRACDGDSVVIGRSDKADIALDDHSVSRRHARFFRAGAGWRVEDLGSRNGTLLNGRVLSGAEDVRPGDAVRIGDTMVRVRSAAQEGPLASAASAVTDAQADSAYFSVLRPASELMQAGDADAKAASRLQLLNEVHRALARPISRDELLQMILDRAFAVLQPEQAAIFLKGADGELYQAAARQSAAASGSLLVSRRLAEEVTVKGAAALVLDAQADERFASAKSVLVSGVRSIVAAPLSDAEGCLGMIALYSSIHVRRFSEQDLELLASLAAVAAMRIRNISLAEAEAARRVFDRELSLAREIQTGMLRRRPPDREEMDLGARLMPARTVGGDFYDFLLDGDSLWFIVADVSGKGMAAALMMAVGQTLFRAIAQSGLALGEVMARMNRELSRDNDGAMFVTAFGGRLDLASGRVQLANAGHNLPYCLRRDGRVELIRATNSLAFGVLEDATFPITDVTLAPNEALLLYTDGVCDAVDPRGASFGTDGLERLLETHARLRPADALVQRLFDAVQTFAGDAPQEDDITLTVVRYCGPPAPITHVGAR